MVGPPRLELGTIRFSKPTIFIMAWTISSPSALTVRVPEANDVLRNKIVLHHLVSEPSRHAYRAWLLIGLLIFEFSFPAIHPVFH